MTGALVHQDQGRRTFSGSEFHALSDPPVERCWFTRFPAAVLGTVQAHLCSVRDQRLAARRYGIGRHWRHPVDTKGRYGDDDYTYRGLRRFAFA